MHKIFAVFGLAFTLFVLSSAASAGTAEETIQQAVGYLNEHQWEKWVDLWVPEDREAFRKALKEQPEDTGLKNIKKAKLIRQVDVTGKIPINPNYPFVEARAYYLEMDLSVKKESPGFKKGGNNHLVLLVKKTPNDSWALRQWGASPELDKLLKPQAPPAPAKKDEHKGHEH